jgi:hypothetical protein
VKKSIHELRDQLADAEEHFEVLHMYGDHIVIVLAYTIPNADKKMRELKEYIEKTFAAILHVDVFTQYVVIWHDYHILSPEHMKKKRP